MTPKRPSTPLKEGAYSSLITNVRFDADTPEKFTVEHFLSDDNGNGYRFFETFFNSTRSRRFLDFLDYVDRALDYEIEDLDELVGIKERIILGLSDEVNGRRFLNVISREFVSHESEVRL